MSQVSPGSFLYIISQLNHRRRRRRFRLNANSYHYYYYYYFIVHYIVCVTVAQLSRYVTTSGRKTTLNNRMIRFNIVNHLNIRALLYNIICFHSIGNFFPALRPAARNSWEARRNFAATCETRRYGSPQTR